MASVAIDIRVLGTGRTSGVEGYTERLLEHMLALDPSISFKLFYAGRTPLVRRSWMDRPNVSIYERRFSNRLLTLRGRLLGRPHLDALVDGADVFFFPHFLVGPTSSRCKRVLTIHDLSFERFSEFFSLSRQLWHRVQIKPRLQVRQADKIIAVSESTRADLIGLYGVDPSRVSVVHSGVDSSLRPPSASHGAKRFILSLGTLEPRKNIAALVKAFGMLDNRFSDVELIVAGHQGWLWQDIQGDRIRFIGEVGYQERLRLLSSASLLVYPSLFEGFGFPPLEAMACGTPAIVGANSSMLEVCGQAALQVNPYNAWELKNAIQAVLEEKSLRDTLIARGLEHVQSFSWEITAKKTLETILSTL